MADADRHPNDVTTDDEIDVAIERAKAIADEPRIVEATFRGEPGLDLLLLTLSDGRRLVFPREDLPELKNATPEQAADFFVGRHGVDLRWPQLDEGIYLPNLLAERFGAGRSGVAA
jgi:hypothetical protein